MQPFRQSEIIGSHAENFLPLIVNPQATYQTNFVFGTPANDWTLSSVLAYSDIPDPGQRPDLPAAHVLAADRTVLKTRVTPP